MGSGRAGYGSATPITHAATEYGPQVDMRVDTPRYRLDDPGAGLRHNGRRVLTYADLRNLRPTLDPREPGREIQLHLTGNMARCIWSFDGIKYADAEPLRVSLWGPVSSPLRAAPPEWKKIRRELAPYLGVNWAKQLSRTADFAREKGEHTDDLQLVVGIRAWF
jgi:hypothetical protein